MTDKVKNISRRNYHYTESNYCVIINKTLGQKVPTGDELAILILLSQIGTFIPAESMRHSVFWQIQSVAANRNGEDYTITLYLVIVKIKASCLLKS